MDRDSEQKRTESKSRVWDNRIYFTDDVVEDVVVDEVDPDALAVHETITYAPPTPAARGPKKAPSPWGPCPPFRKPSDKEEAPATVEDKIAARTPKRTGLKKILYLPVDILNRIIRYVLYSGITKHSPLMATIRMFMVMMPVFLSVILSYWSMSYLFPTYDRATSRASAPISSDASGVAFNIGSRRLRVPLPQDYEIIPLDEYHRLFPLTAEAAMADKGAVAFAAKSTREGEEVYFINVIADDDLARQSFNEAQFKKTVSSVAKMKDIQSSIQVGPNQVIGPFDEGPLSVCYGRRMGSSGLDGKPAATLQQYSCLLYLEGRAVILTAGYSMESTGTQRGDLNHCRTVLTAWRDSILQR